MGGNLQDELTDAGVRRRGFAREGGKEIKKNGIQKEFTPKGPQNRISKKLSQKKLSEEKNARRIAKKKRVARERGKNQRGTKCDGAIDKGFGKKPES